MILNYILSSHSFNRIRYNSKLNNFLLFGGIFLLLIMGLYLRGLNIALYFTIMIFLILFFNMKYENLVKLIFYSSFFLMFIGHKFIQENIFSIDSFEFKTRIYWIFDFLIIICITKLLIMKKYKNNVIKFSIFFLIYLLIHYIVNSQSPINMTLAIRSNYIFIPLLFVLIVYKFDEKFYINYFKLFYFIALINSILSFLSLLYFGPDVSGDFNGGVFGLKGTGIGVIFATAQGALFIHLFIDKNKMKYIIYSLISFIFIITAKAYFGFVLILGIGLIIFFHRYKGKKNFFKKIIVVIITVPIIFYATLKMIPQDQLDRYYGYFTNIEALLKYDKSSTAGYGRIISIQYSFDQIERSFINFLFGFGPGSISYSGATTGIESSFMKRFNIESTLLSMTFIYELGFLGVFAIIFFFIHYYLKWKKIKIPVTGINKGYLDNFPVVLFVFFASIFYAAAFKIYFLIFYFGINLSYINQLYNSKLNIQSKNSKNLHESLNRFEKVFKNTI